MAKSDSTKGSGTGRKRAAGTGTETAGASAEAAGGGVSRRGRAKAGDAAAAATTATGGSTAKKTGGARKTAGGGRGRAAAGGGDLRSDLREFISSRPEGWSHDDWTGLLGRLGERGHDVSNPDQVGMALERERLASVLERVEGLEGHQVEALTDRFQTLWSFRHASTDDVASTAGIDPGLAERAKQSVG
jgi:hypothetical protein